MQKILLLLLFAAFVLTTPGICALADPPQYTLQFLGEGIKIEGMNENGLVTGWQLSPSPAQGFVAGLDHPFELLPLPSGFTSSEANDINDAGVIVGTVHAPGLQRAAAWYPDGQGGYDIDLLGALPGHEDSAASAINNRGEIVGVSFLPGAGAGWSVWFNSPSGTMNILELDAPSQAQEVNDNGLVVGFGGRTFDLDTLQSMPLPPGQLAGTAVLAANSNDEFSEVAQWTAGDFTANGVVDGGDFLLWNANKFSSADTNVTAVPEPAAGLFTIWLAFLALCATASSAGRLPCHSAHVETTTRKIYR